MRLTARTSKLPRFWIAALSLAALCLSAVAAQGQSGSKAIVPLEEMEGFVDFDAIDLFGDDDLAVEINLSGALMRMISSGLEGEDAEFAQLMSKLRHIRVNIFDISEQKAEAATKLPRTMARNLGRKGWESVVHVRGRDGDGDVYILVRTEAEAVVGLMAMFTEPGETVGFINIVGEVDPGQIARIGRQLDIDGFNELEAALGSGGKSEDRPEKKSTSKGDEP